MRGIPADDPQAAAEAHYVAAFNAWMGPARLTQWAAGVLLAAMDCEPTKENTLMWAAVSTAMDDAPDRWVAFAAALRALAGEAGQ
jgi:hypothetical protein